MREYAAEFKITAFALFCRRLQPGSVDNAEETGRPRARELHATEASSKDFTFALRFALPYVL